MKGETYPLTYVEIVNDAGTTRTVVFSVLLDRQVSGVEVWYLGGFGRRVSSISRGFLLSFAIGERAWGHKRKLQLCGRRHLHVLAHVHQNLLLRRHEGAQILKLRSQILHLRLLSRHLLAQFMEFRLGGLGMLNDPVLELTRLRRQSSLHKPGPVAQPENEITDGAIPPAGGNQPVFCLDLMFDMTRDRSSQPLRDPLAQWLFRPILRAAVLAPILEPLGHVFQLDEDLSDRRAQGRGRKRIHRPFLTLVRRKCQEMNRFFRQTLLFPRHSPIEAFGVLSVNFLQFITLSHSPSQWRVRVFFCP